MKILVLSFYYPPDLSAGAFRCAFLIEHLQRILPKDAEIHLITTLPNRFASYDVSAETYERQGNLTIERIALPATKGGIKHQALIFNRYIFKTCLSVKKTEYDLVYATSSKLFTATFGACLARWKRCSLYLDIRDIFADTLKDTLPKRVSKCVIPVFSGLEKWTIKRASHVNLVSPGFSDYFKVRYPKKTFSFHTNGVDEHLVNQKAQQDSAASAAPINVVYAGTLGEGQGLDLIIPQLAIETNGKLFFRIIGEGARKEKLQKQLKALKCTNVELVAPMDRFALIKEYEAADVLFLHLNDYEAFQKVLPSKLFEYAAMGKPIWAGVGGYAATFVTHEISNASVFNPGNIEAAKHAFSLLDLKTVPRVDFISKYLRENIMKKMAEDVFSLALEKR